MSPVLRTIGCMTLVPPPPVAGVATPPASRTVAAPSRTRRAWALTGSIALAVLCGLLALSAGGSHDAPQGAPHGGAAGLITGYAMLGVFPMLGASVLLVWRHRAPVIVATITMGLTVVVPTTALPALVCLAAVTYARRGWLRWAFIVAAFVATVVADYWDLMGTNSALAALFDSPRQGTPAHAVLLWLVPVLAAIAVAPFAAFGMGRRLLSERDAARRDSASARHTVNALQLQVDQQRERQEIARELHDTLAADLSQVALHAGALELIVGEGDQRAVSAARVVRESTQHSLDDLRHMVRSLRDHDRAIGTGQGLGELPALIDDTLRGGLDVRAQVLVNDAASCSARVGHAAYRIVQEAISNVRRHAPGATLHLDVRGGPADGITIRCTNWLVPQSAPTSTGGGNGLTGMSERAHLVGGTFLGGVTPEGSFAITAWMPWAPSAHVEHPVG